MLTVFFYIISLIGIALLAFITYSKRSNRSSTIFSLMSFALSIWLFVQFIAIRNPEHAYGITVFGLFIFGFIPVLSFAFALEFVGNNMISKKNARFIMYSSLFILSVLAFWPGTFISVEVINNALVIESGIGYLINSAISIFLTIFSLLVFIFGFRHFTKEKKSSVYFMLIGIFIAIIGNTISGTLYSNVQSVQFLGPLSILLMTLLFTYAITKHKLFDVKLLVVRSLVYVLSLGSILAITALVVFSLSNYLIKTNTNQDLVLWILVILTLLFSISYQYIKSWFDKFSNKLFYRDSYRTQELLNEFNQALVSSLEIQTLIKNASSVIKKYVKPDNLVFVFSRNKKDFRTIGTEGNQKNILESLRLENNKEINEKDIVVTDFLKETGDNLKSNLQKKNVGVITTVKTENDRKIGYLVLGYKKTGNLYNNQDIGVLKIISKELAIAIENAIRFEEIERFNITLRKKIDDATRELKKNNEKLKALDEAKDEFVSMASHQLRTPLTSIKGYISMVMEGDAGKITKSQEKMLGQAFFSSQSMVYLISDLLNVSRLKTGKFVIEAKPVYLPDVIESELGQLKEGAAAKNITLAYEKPKKFSTMNLDEMKIRQVIMNFTDNAIYYTKTGGKIVIGLKETSKSVEFTVKDNGIGVPKSEQHKLFSKFYRADNAKKARPDGTGLGLFMAKKVILSQGGSVIFNSKEGGGSTFGFSFPKDKLEVEKPEELPKKTKTQSK